MIIITGTQRSGTSMMAKFFKLCGYDLGTDFWDDRIDGGLENPDICNFYRDVLGNNQFPFTRYWELIGTDTFRSIHNLDLKVAKFSYLLMCPTFVTQWIKSRGKKDKFIIMWRDIRAVVNSKNSRQEFKQEDWSGLNQTAEELQQNRIISIDILKKHGLAYIIVPFPDKNINIQELSDFCNLPLSAKVWYEFFNTKKIHFK